MLLSLTFIFWPHKTCRYSTSEMSLLSTLIEVAHSRAAARPVVGALWRQCDSGSRGERTSTVSSTGPGSQCDSGSRGERTSTVSSTGPGSHSREICAEIVTVALKGIESATAQCLSGTGAQLVSVSAVSWTGDKVSVTDISSQLSARQETTAQQLATIYQQSSVEE